jgi:hypothetical protein
LTRWYVNSSGSRFFFVGGFVALWEAGFVDALVCEFKRFPLLLRWRLCGVVVAIYRQAWLTRWYVKSSGSRFFFAGGAGGRLG